MKDFLFLKAVRSRRNVSNQNNSVKDKNQDNEKQTNEEQTNEEQTNGTQIINNINKETEVNQNNKEIESNQPIQTVKFLNTDDGKTHKETTISFTHRIGYNANHILHPKSILRQQQYNRQRQITAARKLLIGKEELRKNVNAAIENLDWYEEQMKLIDEYNINISTMTITCKMRAEIDLLTLGKNLILKHDAILMIKYAEPDVLLPDGTLLLGRIIVRTIVDLFEKIVKKNKKQTKVNASIRQKRTESSNFYSQNTVLVQIDENYTKQLVYDENGIIIGSKNLPVITSKKNRPKDIERPINLKVFTDGSIQGTGGINVRKFYKACIILIRALKNPTNKAITYLVIPEAPITISNTSVDMINSNFSIGRVIDLCMLAQALKRFHGQSSTEPIKYKWRSSGGRSCINIKFPYDECNSPSIFLFQSGNVIVTGGRKLLHLTKCKEFVLNLVTRYSELIPVHKINKKDIVYHHAQFLKMIQSIENNENNN